MRYKSTFYSFTYLLIREKDAALEMCCASIFTSTGEVLRCIVFVGECVFVCSLTCVGVKYLENGCTGSVPMDHRYEMIYDESNGHVT